MTALETVKDTVLQLSSAEQGILMGWMLQTTESLVPQTRLHIAIQLYALGELTTGLAARLAGVPRSEFFIILSNHNLSPFGMEPEDLVQDLANAEQASYHQ